MNDFNCDRIPRGSGYIFKMNFQGEPEPITGEFTDPFKAITLAQQLLIAAYVLDTTGAIGFTRNPEYGYRHTAEGIMITWNKIDQTLWDSTWADAQACYDIAMTLFEASNALFRRYAEDLAFQELRSFNQLVQKYSTEPVLQTA